MEKLRKTAGLIAAVLVVALGCGLLLVTPIFGVMLATSGLALMVWQALALWRAREDPYDLKKLWDAPVLLGEESDDQPDESGLESDSMAYCHQCGHAVPTTYARCPECGNLI
jgi:hypothetical protein